MKTEVNAEELASLYNINKKLNEEVKQLREQLEKLNPDKLRNEYERKAMNAAAQLSQKYLCLVFSKLGFRVSDAWFDAPLKFPDSVEHWLGENWYEKPERINVKVLAQVEKEFKTLTIKMGIVSNKEDIKKLPSILD